MAVRESPEQRHEAPVRKRRFTVEEYYRMAAAGILREDERVELIEGEVIESNPIGIKHASRIKRLIAFLTRSVGEAAIVDVQNPVRFPDDTEPQPDVVLLKPREDSTPKRTPSPKTYSS